MAGAGAVTACGPGERSGETPGPGGSTSTGATPTPSPQQTGPGGTIAGVCAPGLPEGDTNPGPFQGQQNLRLSPDGALLAVAQGSSGDLVVHDVATGAIAHRFEVHSSSSPAWLAERVLCWATGESVIVADLESGSVHHFRIYPEFVPPEGEGVDAEWAYSYISGLVASPDGRRIAFGDDRNLLVSDPHDCTIEAFHAGTVASEIGLTDTELVARVRGELLVLDPITGEPTRELGSTDRVNSLRWAADGTTLLRGFVVSGGAQRLEVVDVASGEVLAEAHEERVGQPVSLSGDGAIVVGSPRETADKRVLVWDHAADEVSVIEPGESVWDVEHSPAGILYASGAGGLKAWDVATVTQLDITFER
ncbi:hypothetical protein GCM10028820_01090 [Tessaracoccus terricola]